jgi:hypothetical protein
MVIKKNDEFEAIYPTLDIDGLTFLNIVDISEERNSSDKEVFCNPLMPTIPLTTKNISTVERSIDSEVNITSGSQLDKYWERYAEIIELDRTGITVPPDEEFANDNLDA